MNEHTLQSELAAIEAESIGWLPLGDGAYLHVGDPEALVITVVGVPEVGMAEMNVCGWSELRLVTTVSEGLA